MSVEMMPIAFHAGNQLRRDAELYPSVADCVGELVQNSIDGSVHGSKVEVDINYRTRVITVRDNGKGVSPTQFREKLSNVSQSTKKETGNYGQFGLGFFSPFGKCEHFTLTSQPKHDSKVRYIEYAFDVLQIVDSSSVKIPSRELPDFLHESQLLGLDPKIAREKTVVWWRTEVRMTKVSTDRAVCRFDLDAFCQSIGEKYGEKIRTQKLDVIIKFTPEKGAQTVKSVHVAEFTGTKLDDWGIKIAHIGQVKLSLYLAIRTTKGRQGRIVFGQLGNPFNLTATQFVACAERYLGSELGDLLKSGLFEGRIAGENLKLHADRTKFHDDDALEAFSIALQMWHKKVGRKYVEELRERDRDTRFQTLGLQAMMFAETLFGRTEYKEIFQGIKIGTVGRGHTEISGAKEDPFGKAVSTSAVNTQSGQGGESGGSQVRGKEYDGHVSAIVYGQGGRTRSIVKGSSTGLRFYATEFDCIHIPLRFEMKTGTIFINTRHPDWAKCEPSDKALVEYHRLITQTALDLYRFIGRPTSEFIVLQEFAFANLSTQVYGLLNASTIMSAKKK